MNAYLLDSGIRMTHNEFQGRASCGFSFWDDNCIDEFGDGTMRAGIVVRIFSLRETLTYMSILNFLYSSSQGGVTHGAAKNVTLISVKVLDSSGHTTLERLVAGLNYVVQRVKDEAELTGTQTPSIVSVRQASGIDQFIDDVINDVIDAGLTVVVSAGSLGVDACTISPARGEAITVRDDVDWRA